MSMTMLMLRRQLFLILGTMLLLICLFFVANSVQSLDDTDTPSAYEMLEKYNFPRGMLPEGVTGYILQADGYFEVYFQSECEFKVAKKYLAWYDKKISGYIDTGTLKSLNGISVKVLFIWIGVTEVDRTSETEIDFYLGPISASFGVSSFQDSPKCRRNLDDCSSNTTATAVM